MPERQKDNILVLPRDSLGYGDGILMLEKSVGVQKSLLDTLNGDKVPILKKHTFFRDALYDAEGS